MKNIVRFLILNVALVSVAQSAPVDLEVFKARRAALMEALDGRVAVLYGAEAQVGGVTEGLFIQESDFYYLTGISEPGAGVDLERSGLQVHRADVRVVALKD